MSYRATCGARWEPWPLGQGKGSHTSGFSLGLFVSRTLFKRLSIAPANLALVQTESKTAIKLVSCQCECLAETKVACGFLMACRCLWAQRGPGTMLTAVKVQCRGCTSVRPIHEQIIDRKLARLIQMKLRFSPRNLWKGPNSRSRSSA